LQAKYRLKKNYQYNYVYKHSEKVSDRLFIVLYCKSKVEQSKIGFSVSKKYGCAVVRNRLRRQLKAAVRLIAPLLVSNYNIVVVPRKMPPYNFCDIQSSLNTLFQKAGLVVNE
jgi:ribonuclease P protein component